MPYHVGLDAPREVRVHPYDRPPAAAHEVAVRTLYSGISAGTELTTFRGTNPYLGKQWDAGIQAFVARPTALDYPVDNWGYSEVGVVTEVGAGVTALAAGDTVWGIWGHRSDAVLDEDALATHRLAPNLDPLVGTFDRVAAVALNAVLASQACLGETVAVFGQGVVGLLATQLLRAQGNEVLAIDTQPYRLALAARWGATPLHPGDGDVTRAGRKLFPAGVDRVIELSGAYPALHQAIRMAGPEGTVIAAGFYQGGAGALALGEEFHHNQVTVQSSQIGAVPGHLRGRWTRNRLHETVMDLCAQGRLDPLPLISHVVDARDAARAYELLDDPPADLLQVVLDFTRGES